jgi:hypothetical protein
VYRRTNARIYDNVKRSQEKRLSATLKTPARTSSPQGERRVRGGRLESAAGNLPNSFSHPEITPTSRFLKRGARTKSDKQRILNVEGHGDSTEMVKLFSETKSCEVVIANEMAEGFAPAMGGRSDLNILGATFTDGSGDELARRIRAFDPMPPPVFYSAETFTAEVREAAGAV